MTHRILVVEDQEDLRRSRDLRWRAPATRSSRPRPAPRASPKPKASFQNLVVMDIQLPVLDGYESTRRIKALPGMARTTVIAVSSFAMRGDEEKARAAGCDGYVTKPYSPKQLVDLVRQFLAKA